jgi:hypothetical protein
VLHDMLISLLGCVSRKAGVAEGIHLVRKVTYRSLYISSVCNWASGVNVLHYSLRNTYAEINSQILLKGKSCK